MTVLEEVMQMKNQGMQDNEIANKLQERGVSPKEVEDALNQAQIKSAVSAEYEIPGQGSSQQNSANPYAPKTQEVNSFPQQDLYTPQPQNTPPPQFQEQNDASQGEEYYPQETYGSYGGGFDTSTMIEIAEQVFSEKIKQIEKHTEKTEEFKTLAQTKIENISERLRRIETIIDKLQANILEKISSYGSNLSSIKKEMSMMQDSFGKVVNQAVRGDATKSGTIRKTTSTPRKRISRK